MYKLIVRPILFCFDPELVHNITFKLIKFFHFIPGFGSLMRFFFLSKNENLKKDVLGIRFSNPVGLAAGFDKNAKLFSELSNFGFGFIEIGTVTPKAQPGNPKKRVFRITQDNGIINRLGINNDGAEAIINRLKNNKSIIIGGNIGKNTSTPNVKAVEDYLYNFTLLHPYVDYFVVNVSCPNVKEFTQLQDKKFLLDLSKKMESINTSNAKRKPVLLKISPELNSDQLDEIIEIINTSSFDGVVATNTTTSRINLKTNNAKIKAIGNGGLSGKPLKETSNSVIKYLSTKSKKSFPIIGVGGIHTAEDAIEKLRAGADLVQLYTGFVYEGPSLIRKINKLILKNQNISTN
ncbi:MAG: quinone-dependent dihydroorotate dehydrogenase [Bacteroidota bacterium]|nr:quinone-dependent dihydroorotate dehydrogenase [Bacteroidota bacterium]